MKMRKRLLTGILLVIAATAPLSAQMPPAIKSALLNSPPNALVGIGTANNAMLAQIFARADIARQLHSEINSMSSDFRAYSYEHYVQNQLSEAVSRQNTILTFGQIGLRFTGGLGANTQGTFAVTVTDFNQASELHHETGISFQEMSIGIITVTENMSFAVQMRSSELCHEGFIESIEGLDTAGRDWKFMTGADGELYWQVIESRDALGGYWILVTRSDLYPAANLPPASLALLAEENGMPAFVNEAIRNARHDALVGIGVASNMGNFNLQRAVAASRAQVSIAQQIAQQIETSETVTYAGTYYTYNGNIISREHVTRMVSSMELGNVGITASGTDTQGSHWVVVEVSAKKFLEQRFPNNRP